ncbi:MAG: Bax inhibitor-1/YccA family protein [Wenzhouxiangellaceae bacterium]|nr:Bax inhibitor-1/YccA family protein [Wenzhouxiangellaceae bacterium]
MNDRIRTATYGQTGTASRAIDDDARRVLRNTWNLLALTLLFSAGTALLSMANNWPHPGLVLTLVGYFGLLFLTMYLRNSVWGLVSVFALTGFMGLTLGPIIGAYLTMFSNGHELVAAAFGATGVAFFGLSAFAVTTKRDFSFLGSFLFAGILVAFLAGLAAAIFNLSALGLVVSAMFAVLMCGLIVFQTQQIVRGGERNYIMATVTLFVSIYNLFLSLLHLLGFFFGEE